MKEGQLGNLVLDRPVFADRSAERRFRDRKLRQQLRRDQRPRRNLDLRIRPDLHEATDQHTYFYYMVSATKMLILQAFAYDNYPQFDPAVGEADLTTQTPYSVASVSGNYVLQAHNGNGLADALMLLTFDGAGDISGVVDLSQVGSVSSTVVGAPQFCTDSDPAGEHGDIAAQPRRPLRTTTSTCTQTRMRFWAARSRLWTARSPNSNSFSP